MNEQEYLEYIRIENENHRAAIRQDHLVYIENVKQALIDVQTQQNVDALRANFAATALNGILTRPCVDYTKKDEISKHAWEYADKMIEIMSKQNT